GRDDLPKTLASLKDDAPAILLAHEPDIFPDVPARYGLTLSGHTHGGQVQFFGWAPKVPSIYGARYLHGRVTEADPRGVDRDLIISGGIGCSGAPIRFGRPPELVVVDLAPPRAEGTA
ncbi:MAG: metallophosphoesterase, partial [Pseudomonadota bacterium]